MKFPDDLWYTEHDEWIRLDGETLTIGITDFAQDALGELVHVELPRVGTKVASGDVLCEVESVKAVAEVYSPVSGEVVEVNGDLDGSEDTVNSEPYGGGWLVKVRTADVWPIEGLMKAADYQKKIDEA